MAKNIQVKPGKAGSVLGLIVGCIFVGIGLFVVIPTFGPFGIFGRWCRRHCRGQWNQCIFTEGSPPTRLWWRMTSPKGMLRSIPQRRGASPAGGFVPKGTGHSGGSTTNPASGFWRSYKNTRGVFHDSLLPLWKKAGKWSSPWMKPKPRSQHWRPPGTACCTPVL